MNPMSTPTTPMSLLEAVNTLLACVRISSVMSLMPESLNMDAADAKQALDNASRQMQAEGWYFNTEYNLKLEPDVNSNHINLPANTLRVKVARCSTNDRLIERGRRLYDPKRHTYELPDGASVDIVVALPFEDLPTVARDYVVAVAARAFGIPKLPTGATFRFTEEYVNTARVELERMEIDWADNTLAQSSEHFKRMRRR